MGRSISLPLIYQRKAMANQLTKFQRQILEGIPMRQPNTRPRDTTVSHAPRRDIEGD